MGWIPPELESLLAVAAATLDGQGELLEANAGFLHLLPNERLWSVGAWVAPYFQQPDFASLSARLSGADGEIHTGLLTIGDVTGRTSSVRGRVWRVNGQLRLLAEHDIRELERLNVAVLGLNAGYADAQLELAQTNLRLQQREVQILALTLTDALTGVGNRRRMDEALGLEVGRAERTGEKLSLLIADLDHFKRVNDLYGHAAGDATLQAFGTLLLQGTRPTDIVTRLGGEEFVVLMPHTALPQALVVAERLRAALVASPLAALPEPVTASFGVAEHAMGERGEALLQRADAALYQAKEGGRNRCVPG